MRTLWTLFLLWQEKLSNVFLFCFQCTLTWKQRNIIYFDHHTCEAQKSIILSILTTALYWSSLGADNVDMTRWMPQAPSLIPLQAWDPAEEGHVVIWWWRRCRLEIVPWNRQIDNLPRVISSLLFCTTCVWFDASLY